MRRFSQRNSLVTLSEINITQGHVVERNFRDYQMIDINDAPGVTTAFVRSYAMLRGLGEPAVPPVAPALANALFALTGQRLRELPLRLAPA